MTENPRPVPGMAYFEDTGPLGTTCGECAHFHAYRRVCQQFIKFMGGRGGEAPQIKQSQRSCKYWRRR